MARRIPLLVLPLVIGACGRGIPTQLPIGGSDGSEGGDGANLGPDGGVIVGPDGQIIFVDTGVPFFPDANISPFDAGQIFLDVGFPFDAERPPLRDTGVGADVGETFDAGSGECRSVRDCYQRLGNPACPVEGGFWTCENRLCAAQCPMDLPCRTDCDCPSSLACGGGRCLPLNRNNQCCTNPFCPPGSRCIEPDGTGGMCPTEPPPFDAGVRPDSGFPRRDGGQPPPFDAGMPNFDASIPPFDGGGGGRDATVIVDVGPRDSGVPAVPVGAACMADQACGQNGYCIDEGQGFPGGYCSQQCGRGGMCPGGSTCRNTGGGGGGGGGGNTCLDDCATNAECRMGYSCVQLGTNPQRVCWPVPEGSMNPMGDPVGSSCNGDEDCATGLSCFDPGGGWNGGYCTRYYCDPMTNPCPGGTQCYAFPGLFSLCLSSCPSGGSQSTCRNGYYCLGATGQPGVCISN